MTIQLSSYWPVSQPVGSSAGMAVSLLMLGRKIPVKYKITFAEDEVRPQNNILMDATVIKIRSSHTIFR